MRGRSWDAGAWTRQQLPGAWSEGTDRWDEGDGGGDGVCVGARMWARARVRSCGRGRSRMRAEEGGGTRRCIVVGLHAVCSQPLNAWLHAHCAPGKRCSASACPFPGRRQCLRPQMPPARRLSRALPHLAMLPISSAGAPPLPLHCASPAPLVRVCAVRRLRTPVRLGPVTGNCWRPSRSRRRLHIRMRRPHLHAERIERTCPPPNARRAPLPARDIYPRRIMAAQLVGQAAAAAAGKRGGWGAIGGAAPIDVMGT